MVLGQAIFVLSDKASFSMTAKFKKLYYFIVEFFYADAIRFSRTTPMHGGPS